MIPTYPIDLKPWEAFAGISLAELVEHVADYLKIPDFREQSEAYRQIKEAEGTFNGANARRRIPSWANRR